MSDIHPKHGWINYKVDSDEMEIEGLIREMTLEDFNQ
jgi:hypothetical protein